MTDEQLEAIMKDQRKRFRDAIGKTDYGVVYAKQIKQQIQEGVVTRYPLTKQDLLELLGEAEKSYLDARNDKKTKDRKALEDKLQREKEYIQARRINR